MMITHWTCQKCGGRVSAPCTAESDQDLTCPECGYMIPVEASMLAAIVMAMPDRERHKLFNKIKDALLWRGWDSGCNCHAARIVRDIANLLSKHGYNSEEYT